MDDTSFEDGRAAVATFPWNVRWTDLDPDIRQDLMELAELMAPHLNLPYTPHLKQLQCHLHTALGPAEPLLYGGGMGGGKTSLLCGQAIKLTREIENARAGLFRFTFATLRDTTLKTLRQYAKRPEYVENKNEHRFVRPENGAEIVYAQAGSEADIANLGSLDLTWAGIDEAPQVERPVFEMIQTRVRQIEGARANALGIWLTANPTPGWIKQDFVAKPLPDYAFIPALLDDNPFADPNYADNMRRAMTAERYKAWILGDWDAYIPQMAVIPADLLNLAVERVEVPDWNDCAWGLDPGHLGDDETALWMRAGLVFRRIDRWLKLRTDETTDRVIGLYWGRMAHERPTRINVDIDGVGAGVWDGLVRAQEDGKLPRAPILSVLGVHNNSRAFSSQEVGNPLRYANVKSENFFEFRRMLEDKRGDIENDPDVIADLTTPSYDVENARVIVVSKDVTRRMLGRSPNDGDALLLSFHRGRVDEIAGRTSEVAKIITLQDLQRLEAERRIRAVEQRTVKAIQALTGRQRTRSGRKRNLPY